MVDYRRFVVLVGATLLLCVGARAHVDAPKTSLPQLFMTADFAAIGQIASVQMRSFGDGEQTTRYEVVTAMVASHYKGEPLQSVEFFQFAHGHAFYQPGDTAVIFLQALDEQHQLHDIGTVGDIRYVSQQVGNTKHQLSKADLTDYRWVLQSYADMSVAGDPNRGLQTLSTMMLRMLQSDSPKLVESALLDWAVAGNSIEFSSADIDRLSAIIEDSKKPIGLRLALLREMCSRGLADETAWTYLLQNEGNDNLSFVLAALAGYQNKQLKEPLVVLLDHPSDYLAEGAARALGHPIYSGAEASLEPLLASQNQRLNYAAAQGLVGINSARARTILAEAAARHPNEKVRRMISARLSLLG